MKLISVGVDTNILLHFGKIELLNWRALFPEVTSVSLLISSQVQDEMDGQKDKAKGYVQTRAREFQRYLRAAEDNDYRIMIEGSDVPVEIVFLDHVRKSLLDAESFDLDSHDQLIVAQYKHAVGTDPDFVIVANDAKTIRAARANSLTAVRPDAWTQVRPEPEDENAKELRELRKIVGARPKLELVGFEEHRAQAYPSSLAPDFDAADYLHRLDLAKMQSAGIRSPQALIAEWGIDGRRTFDFGVSTGGLTKLTPEDVAVYEIDVRYFASILQNKGPEWFLACMRGLSRPYAVELNIANVGDAVEELICVDLKVIKNGIFVEPDALHDENDWRLAKPIEPRPKMYPATVEEDDFVEPAPIHEPDHEFGTPKTYPSQQVFRCRSLSHGRSAPIRTFVQPFDRSIPTEVLISVSAKRQVTTMTRRLAIRTEPTPLKEADVDFLLTDRGLFMPPTQQRIIAGAVGVMVLQSNRFKV